MYMYTVTYISFIFATNQKTDIPVTYIKIDTNI